MSYLLLFCGSLKKENAFPSFKLFVKLEVRVCNLELEIQRECSGWISLHVSGSEHRMFARAFSGPMQVVDGAVEWDALSFLDFMGIHV
jgi:hypothetical protein